MVNCLKNGALSEQNRHEFTQIDYRLIPDRYWECEDKIYRWLETGTVGKTVDGMVERCRPLFHVTGRHLKNALMKALVDLLTDDMRLVFLAEALHPESEKVFIVKEKRLMDLVRPDLEYKSIKGRWKSILINTALRGAYTSFKIVSSRSMKLQNLNAERPIIFEQRYGEINGNPEFRTFYQYFKTRDDVVYNCVSADSEIYGQIKSDGKPAMAHWYNPGGFKEKLLATFDLIRCWLRLLFSGLPLDIVYWVNELKCKEIHYSGLIRVFKPKVLLKIRSDFDVWHPIVTGLCENKNVFHLGYQCGNYYHFAPRFAFLDFHAYGVWGRGFNEIAFKDMWPADMFYPVIGPFTVNTLDENVKDGEKKKITVAIFTTSYGPLMANDYQYYDDFLNAAYSWLSGVDADIILKEKGYVERDDKAEKKLRSQYVIKVSRRLNNHIGLPAELVDNPDYSLAGSGEIISQSDLLVVMWHSSTAWEAISTKKKVLIYLDNDEKHHFETHLPELVVRSAEELKERGDWLLSMPQSDYEKLIAPLQQAWARENDGDLVGSFWKEIENLAAQQNEKINGF